MKKIKYLLVLILSTLLLVACSKTDLTTEEKLQDFEQLYNEITVTYPYFGLEGKITKNQWLANHDRYEKSIKSTGNLNSFSKELNNIMGELNNYHSYIVSNKSTYDSIKSISEMSDLFPNLFNKNTDKAYLNMPKRGHSIQNSSNIVCSDIEKNKMGYIKIPQMNPVGNSISEDMDKIADYLKNIQNYDSLIIDIRDNLGGSDEYWKSLVSIITDKTYSTKGYLFLNNESTNMNSYIKNFDFNFKPIAELPSDIRKIAPGYINNLKGFDEINLKVSGKAKYPFKGKIYVLVNDQVFSGAETFSIFCRDTKFATLVGSETLGDGGVSNPLCISLKYSGLIAIISSNMFMSKDGIVDEENPVQPDYYVEDTSSKDILKSDECIDKVKSLESIN